MCVSNGQSIRPFLAGLEREGSLLRIHKAVDRCFELSAFLSAADVCLQERRRLVLLFRETPSHLGHIELMANVTRFGAIVMPPVPAFYLRPASVEEIATQTAARALDLIGVSVPALKRWGES